MELNLPPMVREILYAVQVFVNTVTGSLIAADYKFNAVVLAVIAGYNAVVGLLAAKNVSKKGR